MDLLVIIFGLIALGLLISVFYAARYLARVVMGENYHTWQAIAITAAGYIVISLIAYLNFKDF